MENTQRVNSNFFVPNQFDLQKLIYIKPDCVKYFLRLKKNRKVHYNGKRLKNGERAVGLVLPDNLIEYGRLFQNDAHIVALHQRYVLGLEWEQTDYKNLYNTWYRKIHRGKYSDRTWNEFKEHRLCRWDEIYQNIRHHGYRAERIIRNNIEVCIDKNGDVLFIDGRHRLFFAQALNLQSVPAVVNIWSESFVSFLQGSLMLPSLVGQKMGQIKV